MRGQIDKYAALKHAAYVTKGLLPGEDPAAFDYLHRGLVAEFNPVGTLEEDIIADLAQLMWRRRNLVIYHLAALAQKRTQAITSEKLAKFEMTFTLDPAEIEEVHTAAENQAKQELGDAYVLVEMQDIAKIETLEKELAVKERLNSMIDKCVKRLLLVRGLKSMTWTTPAAAPTSPPTEQLRVCGPSQAT